jgi:glucose-1-phosphate adenylyltransferase
MQRVHLQETIVSEGCRIEDATIDHSVIGIRSIIGRGARLSHTVMMGADFYETPEDRHPASEGIPVGIGAGSIIERAIIDKNARIGEGVVIRNEKGLERHDGTGYYIRDGIVIVPKNGAVPAGTVI